MQEILEKIENCNGFETRKVLAQEFDMPLKVQDIVRPQKDGSVRLETTFTKEQFEELKQAKSLLSHIAHSGSWAEVISVMAKKTNQAKLGKLNNAHQSKSDNIKNNRNNNSQSANNENPMSGQSQTACYSKNIPRAGSATDVRDLKLERFSRPSTVSRRPPISVHLKRKLFVEAQGCCQYQSPDGARCRSQFQLQRDHITPVAWGGAASVENLRLLCRTHNLLAARELGLH